MNWHYVEQERQIGPVTEEQLAELFQSGKVNDETLVWRGGLEKWIPYREIRPGASPPTAPPTTPVLAGEVVCSECGQIFPESETIRHGNARVCAGCKPVLLQKLSEGARISTGELDYASIGLRFGAALLDGLLLGAVNVGINLVAGFSLAQTTGREPAMAATLQLVLFAINTAVGVTYETVLIGKYGATLGKMACKIKVVTADGGQVSYARAFGRYFAKMLSAFTCLIGYLIALFDNPQKRALHDHICNTRVVLK